MLSTLPSLFSLLTLAPLAIALDLSPYAGTKPNVIILFACVELFLSFAIPPHTLVTLFFHIHAEMTLALATSE